MPDRQFVAPFGDHAAPADWLLPASLQIVPKLVYAKLNGAGAAGAYKPCLRIVSDSGHVAVEAVAEIVVAAGASADVSWFPGVDEDAPAPSIPGVTFETLFLHSAQSAGITSSTVLVSGQTYTFTVQGTYVVENNALNIGTPNADAMFPTSDGDPRTSTQVGMDPEAIFARSSTDSLSIGHTLAFLVNLGSGFQHIEPSGGPFATPQAGYLYTYTVVGQGSTVTFKIGDSPAYNDNYGALRIILQNPAAAGGSGTLLPATDATLNGDVLTTVAGIPAWAAPASGGGTISDLTSTGGSLAVTAPTGPTTNAEVAASGVTAATYGDSTHVAQVAVGADGRVTNASSVAISGSAGAGGLIQLYDSGYLGADAASIDTGAGGIASGHVCLVIVAYLRSTAANSNDNVTLIFNNDTAAHYNFGRTTAQSGSVAGSVNVAQSNGLLGLCPGANMTAGYFGSIYGTAPAYDGTSNFKVCHALGDALDDNASRAAWSDWVTTYNQTTAISRLKIATSANVKAGSRLLIYGVQ